MDGEERWQGRHITFSQEQGNKMSSEVIFKLEDTLTSPGELREGLTTLF